MNDLLSSSSPDHHVIEMTPSKGDDLGKFFQDVEAVQSELDELQKLNKSLRSSHEQSKTLHNAKAVKDLRTRMDADVHLALKNAKILKVRLDALDRSNAANRSLPGCGPGSSSDRTRTSVVNGLRKKLKDSMDSFNDLRQKISSEYRETVQRRYFTVTGDNPDEKTVDLLISTGESETFLQKAIQEQGRGRVLDTISEIQERHDGVKAMERNLNELHQVFMDMAVLVQAQGEQLDDIQSHVERANSYVHAGNQQLQKASIETEFKTKSDGMFKGIYNGKQCHVSDIATVLSRAWTAGVDRIIVTGGSLEESKEALTIAETDARLFCTVGVHPTRCKEFEESGDPDKHFQALLSLAKEGIEKGKVVAIGECGLDYDRLQFCPAEIQKKYFEKQFELAHATKLPMFLHMRAAAPDFCEIVERNRSRFSAGVAHSFTGSAEDRDKLLSISNMYIGVNGCSLKTAENLDVVRSIPIERMMIETDSPYCGIKNTSAGIKFVKSTWPSKKKEKYDQECIVKDRNEPCLVRQVLEVVAGCKGISEIGQLSRTLYHNTCRVFFPQDLDSAADSLLAGHDPQ
ncbi:unnamed protein product [Prunus brigantina]